jgi:hypothetical protein
VILSLFHLKSCTESTIGSYEIALPVIKFGSEFQVWKGGLEPSEEHASNVWYICQSGLGDDNTGVGCCDIGHGTKEVGRSQADKRDKERRKRDVRCTTQQPRNQFMSKPSGTPQLLRAAGVFMTAVADTHDHPNKGPNIH